MKMLDAINILKTWDKNGRYVFTRHDLRKLFIEDSLEAFNTGIKSLVNNDILIRACRGVYVNHSAHCRDIYTIEHIAKALRPGKYNYVSLESMLSEYGVISQIPIDRITIMTTGRRGTHKTSYGVIEFTHTQRDWLNILKQTTTVPGRPLRIAYKLTAWRDLKRVGRNTNMVNLEELSA